MKVLRVAVVGILFAGVALAQQKPAAKGKVAAKAPMAVWSQDVMRTFGILPSAFATSGLNKLTQDQLNALIAGAKPKVATIACPAANTSGKIRLMLTVSGEDPNGTVADAIHQAVGALGDVQLVDAVSGADATARVVVQTLSVNQKTIGYTAAYVLGVPCVQATGEKKSDVELKGVLGSTMNAKSAGMAQDLATTLDKELRAAGAAH